MRLLDEGQVINDTYVVERFLGEGAFGEVYRVKHRFLGRQAMKVFKMDGMTIQETEDLLAEAVMLSRLGHPNVIRVFEANLTETARGMRGFFTMEYVAGGSLDQFWRSHGAQFVPIETTVDILRQACRGLGVSHTEKPPIVHRDIKPGNTLVGYDAGGLRVKISDFGLAKRVNPLTLMVSARGTPAFKPPEVFTDPMRDSCAADVWALGTTLYLLLTDRLPYATVFQSGVPDLASFKTPPPPPSALNIQVDRTLDRITARALAIRPEDRYPTAMAMLEDLARWQLPPAAKEDAGASGYSEIGKAALGGASPLSEHRARTMASEALKLAQQAGRLVEAADLMEEAFNRWPELRDEYEFRVKNWRRGVVM